MKPLNHAVILLSLLMFLFLGGCAVNPVTGKKELALFQVSTEEEIAIGEKSYPQVIQQMKGEYPDPALARYVQEVGAKLGRVSQRPELPYQFKVVNDSSPNAFALPGGYIAISRGLLVELENEAQLAAVLGHEVGHVTARHSVAGMQRGTLLGLGMAVLTGVTGESAYGPVAQQAGQVAAQLLDSSYSREQERESDRLGIDYMVRAGYNPLGSVQLQEFFYRQTEGSAEPMWLSGLFRTHPFSRDRMLANQDYVRSQYAFTLQAGDFSFREDPFLKATAGLRAKKKAYELYDAAQQLEAQNNMTAAIETYLQALDAAPGEALIYTGLGLASLRMGDLAPARRYLQEAIRLNGNYYESRMGLGYVYLQRNENQAAVTELEKAMELMPSLQGAYLLAEAYEKTAQTAKALELYQAVAKADPQGKLGQAAAGRIKALGGRL